MSQKNILTPWQPLSNVTLPLYVEALHDDNDGFKILLRGESATSRILRISFDAPLSYRNTNESYLLELWHSTDAKNLGKVFYFVENSSYIDFFNNMTENIYLDWDVNHYAVYTIADCVDILSSNAPIVGWMD
jgi:hypothetical protein